MFKRFSCALLVVCSAVPVSAELCTIDAVPAATLLLPYFEVNLSKPSKSEETLFSINNSQPSPVLAHVTFWTDMSLPTLAFDVALTGYDVQTISLKDLFFNGRLPAAVLPDSLVGFTDLGDLRNAHSGRAVDGECHAQRLSGNRARGYVTIDNVGDTALIFPNDPDYFTDNFLGDNVLWGEYFTFTKKYIEQERLVSIEAGQCSGFSFYGRYSGNTDEREPLGTVWGARYFIGGSQSTHLIVWRDSNQNVTPFDCGDPSSTGAFPLGTTQLVVFDEQEDAMEIVDELPFPAATQVAEVGRSSLPTFGHSSGWIYLNLNLAADSFTQSYVTVRQDLKSRRSRSIAQLLAHAADSQSGSVLRARKARFVDSQEIRPRPRLSR